MFKQDEGDRLRGGQTVSRLRSRILLGILADDECAALGLPLEVAGLDATVGWFQQQHGLSSSEDTQAFFDFAQLDPASFRQIMSTFTNIMRLQRRCAPQLRALAPRYRGLEQVERWTSAR